MEIIQKHIKDRKKIDLAVENSINFIKEEASKFSSVEELVSDSNRFFEGRKSVVRFVNQEFKHKKFNKWEIRQAVIDIFDRLELNPEEDTPEKIIFMLFTDALSELQPTPAPLVFFYQGTPLIKKHGIIIDFNLLPELMQKIEELDATKKHQLVLELFPDDEIVREGVSLKLAQLNFLILNLFDKVLYEEIIPFEKVVIQKDGKLSVDKNIILFGIVSVFASLYEIFTGEKQQFKGSFYTAEFSKMFVKIKHFVKKQVEDKDEFLYLLTVSYYEEAGIENRLVTIRDYETQKNVFEESLRRQDVDTFEKIESIFWLLGIENVNPVLLVRYYNGDDIIYYLFELFRQAQDEGFSTGEFIGSMKLFLKKLFRYPYLSKGHLNKKTLDKPINIHYGEDNNFKTDYLYFTQRYEEFLETQKESNDDNRLKELFAKYFTKQISEDELVGWLALIKSNEGEFFYHLFNKALDNIPQQNPYKYVADLYTVKASHQDIFNIIGEEGTYTLILRLLGFYPFDNTLKNLADLRFQL